MSTIGKTWNGTLTGDWMTLDLDLTWELET